MVNELNREEFLRNFLKLNIGGLFYKGKIPAFIIMTDFTNPTQSKYIKEIYKLYSSEIHIITFNFNKYHNIYRGLKSNFYFFPGLNERINYVYKEFQIGPINLFVDNFRNILYTIGEMDEKSIDYVLLKIKTNDKILTTNGSHNCAEKTGQRRSGILRDSVRAIFDRVEIERPCIRLPEASETISPVREKKLLRIQDKKEERA
jgi:hypothetical protein